MTPHPPFKINVLSKQIPKWSMAADIAFVSEKIQKKKKNRYLVHFHPHSEGQPESLVDDVPRVLKQCRVLGGRIWKICGICQHLTILSRQYSSCLIEKCVLNCRNFFFFPEGPFFFFFFFFQCEDPIEISSDVTAGCCEETVGVQRGFWQDGPEDKRKHLTASYLTTGPERLSGTPLRNHQHISKDDKKMKLHI